MLTVGVVVRPGSRSVKARRDEWTLFSGSKRFDPRSIVDSSEVVVGRTGSVLEDTIDFYGAFRPYFKDRLYF